jgi:hypothetical protein
MPGIIMWVGRPNFEEIGGCLRGLLIRLEDRLPAEVVGEIAEFTDVGEFGLALELVADVLGGGALPVADGERSDMLGLAQQMQMGDRVSRALGLCPGLGETGL